MSKPNLHTGSLESNYRRLNNFHPDLIIPDCAKNVAAREVYEEVDGGIENETDMVDAGQAEDDGGGLGARGTPAQTIFQLSTKG